MSLKIAPVDSNVLGVKLWYADGSCIRIPIEDIDSGWRAAPDFGLQVLAIFPREERNGKRYPQWFAGRDLYAWSPSGGFIETNVQDDLPQDALVIVGSEMDKPEFRELYNRVLQDDQF